MAKKKSGRMSKLKRYGKTGLAAATVPLEAMGIDFMSDLGMLAGELVKAGVPLFKEGGKVKSKSPRGCGMALRGYGKAMKKGKK
jgi:hypothetical protein